MRTLRIGLVVRMTIVAVLVAFVSTPNAKAFTRTHPNVTALPSCQPRPKVNQLGQTCKSWSCLGWNPTLKCCYKWKNPCSPIS